MEEHTTLTEQDDAWTYLDWSEASLLEDRRIEDEHRASKGDPDRDIEDLLTDKAWLACQWQDFLEDFDGILGEISSTGRYRVLQQFGNRQRLEMTTFIDARSAEDFINQVFPTTQGLQVAGQYDPQANRLEFTLSHPAISKEERYCVVALGDSLPS